jgi:hypothetical protein
MTKLLSLIVFTFVQTTLAQRVIKPDSGFAHFVYRGELFALDDYIYDVKDVIFHPGSQAGYRQVQLLLSVTNVTDSGKTFDPSKEMIVLLIGVRSSQHWGTTLVGPSLKLEAKQTGLFAYFQIPEEVMEWTTGSDNHSFILQVRSLRYDRGLTISPLEER